MNPSTTQFSGADLARLKPFFAAGHPNRSMLSAFLNGDIPGEAYVDSETRPTFCLVVLSFLNWSFAGGDLARLGDALAELSKSRSLTLVWNPQDGEAPGGFVERIARAEFSETDFDGLNRVPPLSLPHEIVPMDQVNFSSCLWRDLLVLGYGTEANFLARSSGYSLLVGGTIASDVYVSFFAEGSFELGVVTVEENRRKGYSFEVARHGINQARKRGFKTTWSCDKENRASFDLARKLAYSHLREYEMFVYRVAETEH